MASDHELTVVEARPESPDEALSRSASPDFVTSIPPQTRQDTIHLTPYSRPPIYSPSEHDAHSQSAYPSWSGQDPRSSSTQSLGPEDAVDGKRKLLLIYIHGFMGTETSFQSFPAHVHSLVTNALAESHVVHSKLYPRYKSRRSMNFARDDFSYWLSPHESENTDIILLGHSLGGIMATDVALLPSSWSGSPEMLKHRILGVVNFDVPFLGLHPGVVSAGLGSLFRPKTKSPSPQNGNNGSPTDTTEAISDTLMTTNLHSSSSSSSYFPPNDPNFNPAFPNDVRMKERKQLDSALHFMMKHSDRLVKATKEYVSSHIEFGGCLADYPGLKDRYRRIRALEDIDEYTRKRDAHGRSLRRVRFVNYYTASTGFIKPTPSNTHKQGGQSNGNEVKPPSESQEQIATSDVVTTEQSISQSTTTLVSVESASNTDKPNSSSPPDYETSQAHYLSTMESGHIPSHSTLNSPETALDLTRNEHALEGTPSDLSLTNDTSSISLTESTSWLPALPALLQEPPEFDPSQYPDKDTLKLAQKEHARQVKSYERAKKDREKAVKDRQKLLKKREKAAAKELSKQQTTEKRENVIVQETAVYGAGTPTPTPPALPPREPNTATTTPDYQPVAVGGNNPRKPPQLPPRERVASKPKDRKFCALPSRGADGTRDPLWVRVFMEGIDEVVAHQSLFIENDSYYERLVGDTATRIQEWVQEAQTMKMVLTEMEGLD